MYTRYVVCSLLWYLIRELTVKHQHSIHSQYQFNGLHSRVFNQVPDYWKPILLSSEESCNDFHSDFFLRVERPLLYHHHFTTSWTTSDCPTVRQDVIKVIGKSSPVQERTFEEQSCRPRKAFPSFGHHAKATGYTGDCFGMSSAVNDWPLKRCIIVDMKGESDEDIDSQKWDRPLNTSWIRIVLKTHWKQNIP